MNHDELSDLMPIRLAAKELHLGYRWVRELAIRYRIAVDRGGVERKRLSVKMSDLRRAIVANKYEPAKSRAKSPARMRRSGTTHQHPLVDC